METRTFSSKTQKSDDPSPSPSSPFISQENLDGFSQVPPLRDDSLTGPSSVSPLADDNLDALLGSLLDKETETNPLLPEAETSVNDVFPISYSPPSSSSTEFEQSQLLDLLPYNPRQLNSSRENDCSAWTPWRPNPWVPPKEPFKFVNEPTGVGAGLANLGNTCFINTVLQCFTHTVPFVLGLRSLYHHAKPCACDSHTNSFCLLCALHDHIELSLNSSGGVVSPSKIFDNLDYISRCFKRYQQEDAHEFLQCLLNRLEVCCFNLKPMDDCLSSPDGGLVNKVFGGRLVSRLCCCNCGHISYSYEPFNDLSLEIEDVDTLPSALESFTKLEKIDDLAAEFRCENCKEKVSVEKQLMLDRVPLVATFHLKRFKTVGTYVDKIDKLVFFPLELDLQPYTGGNHTSNEELKYQLYAVVKHSGLTPTSGHYVCYIRSSPDTWHHLNDSIVDSVAEFEVLFQDAYILFYAREDIPWFSTAIEVQKPSEDPGTSNPSPKSGLDHIICASNLLIDNNTDCNTNESKDVADKTSIQFYCETQSKLELDEPSVATEGISESGLLVSEPEFHVPKSVDSRDDSPINESTMSNLGENKTNQEIDKATNDSTFPCMPLGTPCPDKCQRDNSGKKRAIDRREALRAEAMRLAKRMPSGRAKCKSLPASEVAADEKKKRR